MEEFEEDGMLGVDVPLRFDLGLWLGVGTPAWSSGCGSWNGRGGGLLLRVICAAANQRPGVDEHIGISREIRATVNKK